MLQAKLIKPTADSIRIRGQFAERFRQFAQHGDEHVRVIEHGAGQIAQRRGTFTQFLGSVRNRIVRVDSDSNHITAPGEHIDQDAGQLPLANKNVVGPVQTEDQPTRAVLDRVDQRHCYGERNLRNRSARTLASRSLEDQAKREASIASPPAVCASSAAGRLRSGYDQKRQSSLWIASGLPRAILRRRHNVVVFDIGDERFIEEPLRVDHVAC